MSENVRIHTEMWRRKYWLFHRDNPPSHTFFIKRELLTKNNMTIVPHPSFVSLFSPLKRKLKGLSFVSFEVIEAESLAALNIL
jgi:hypothetical protein